MKNLLQTLRPDLKDKLDLNELAQAVHDKYITAAWVLHRKTCRLDARDFLEAVGYKKSFEYVNKKRFKVFS